MSSRLGIGRKKVTCNAGQNSIKLHAANIVGLRAFIGSVDVGYMQSIHDSVEHSFNINNRLKVAITK
jgi:hypothetical protein